MISRPIRTIVRGGAALLAVLTLAGCGEDEPTGPSDDFDLVGQWKWRIDGATQGPATCTVTGVTLTFTRTNGVLSGHRKANGGGNIQCAYNGSPSTANYTTDQALETLSFDGTEIEFTFATGQGTWTMSGTITSDDTMGGTGTIYIASSVGIFALTGPWTATRS